MLCVSAMNPFLFSKVPALLHVMGIRKKIATMFPYIRCPFRISIQRGLGSRRHLLESNDFFALRDLVDLSKGAFAGKWIYIYLKWIFSCILEAMPVHRQLSWRLKHGAPNGLRRWAIECLSVSAVKLQLFSYELGKSSHTIPERHYNLC